MFGTIRKHQTWLWAVIITLTVISFVIYFSPYSKMNSGGGRASGSYGSINGQKVTRQLYVDAAREVELHFFLVANPGHWMKEDRRRTEQDIEREVYHWLLLTLKEEQLGIHASDEAAAEMGRQLIRPFERSEISSPSLFIQKVLEPQGLQVSDFERYIRHFLGIQELMNTFALSGRLITPQEARTLYQRDHQEVATEVVFFSASNYLANVTASPDEVAQFYSNRVATYIIPDRIQVNYVEFPISNFVSQAETNLGTNLTELVEANYQRLGTNVSILFPDAKTTDEYKAKIRERIIRERATAFASQKANVLAHALIDSQSPQAQSFEELAKTNGLTLGLTAPFDLEQGPKDLDVGADFTKQAFALTREEPFKGPLIGREAVYVIGLKKQIPHETPSLDQIRDRVITDYKESRALMMARQAGSATYQAFTNRLAQGETFVKLCNENKMFMIEVAPFSISTRQLGDIENMASLNQLKQAAFGTGVGKLSPFQPTATGGMLLYVKAKLPLDNAKMESDLPAYVGNLRATRQNEAFNEWLSKEAEKGLRDTPIYRRPAPSITGTAAKS